MTALGAREEAGQRGAALFPRTGEPSINPEGVPTLGCPGGPSAAILAALHRDRLPSSSRARSGVAGRRSVISPSGRPAPTRDGRRSAFAPGQRRRDAAGVGVAGRPREDRSTAVWPHRTGRERPRMTLDRTEIGAWHVEPQTRTSKEYLALGVIDAGRHLVRIVTSHAAGQHRRPRVEEASDEMEAALAPERVGPLHAQISDDVMDLRLMRRRHDADGRYDAEEVAELARFVDTRLAPHAALGAETLEFLHAATGGTQGIRSVTVVERMRSMFGPGVIAFRRPHRKTMSP